MKLKLDENLPESLRSALASFGHDVDTVSAEGLSGRPDGDVWGAAQKEGRFFPTQDLDFSDIRKFKPGAHHGVLLLRFRLQELFSNENVEDWKECFVVATERKIRIRKPQ